MRSVSPPAAFESITTEGIPEDIKNLEMSHTSGLEGFPMELNKLTQLILGRNEKIKEVPPGACGKMKRHVLLTNLFARGFGSNGKRRDIESVTKLPVPPPGL